MEEGITNSSNQKIITILKWIFSILMIFSVLGLLANKSFLSSLILLLVASLLFPPFTEFWRNKIYFLKNKIAKSTMVIIVFILGMVACNDVDKTTSISKENDENKVEATDENKTTSTIKYEIVHETIIRYDKAPSYFVLIDEIDLSNDKFKEEIKKMINEIIAQKGNKISIDILDNSLALDLMYKSHYGVNSLGRILTKSELAELERHNIAGYSGELETDIYLNTLYFFPSASKKDPQFGKYVETKEYKPLP